MAEHSWFVAHTLARCEKKLKAFCEGEGMLAVLPCYRSVRRYRAKTVTFEKPLFPGYVFLRLLPEERQPVLQNKHVANLLHVFDQKLFQRQLDEIQAALETDLEIFLAPEIGQGSRVKVKTGPLRGIEGWVEERYGMTTVLLRLDFISQAAAVKLQADALELC